MDGIGVFSTILGGIVFLIFGGYLICVGVTRISDREKGGGLIFILGCLGIMSFIPILGTISELVNFLDTLQRPQYYIEHPESYTRDIRAFVIWGVIAIAMLPAPICCFIKTLKTPTILDRQIVKFMIGLMIFCLVGGLIMMLLQDSNKSNRGECTICGEKATETFQYSEYCAEHYAKAVKWAIDDVADKDN